MLEHNSYGTFAPKSRDAHRCLLDAAQHFYPLARIWNDWYDCVLLIQKLILYLTEILFKMLWLRHGDAQAVRWILDDKYHFLTICLRVEKDRPPLRLPAVKSRNAYFIQKPSHFLLIARSSFPGCLLQPPAAARWQRTIAGTAIKPWQLRRLRNEKRSQGTVKET